MDQEKTLRDATPTFDSAPGAKGGHDPHAVEEFTIRQVLGRGGFGTVYLAYDNTLQREVALKIPHRELVDQIDAAQLYLREARAIASLDHPHIIPVYRAASTTEIPCYIVTKCVRGCHLGQWRDRQRPDFPSLAAVLAKVADALGYAHAHGVVHRDIKPSNVLIDDAGHPYVADFGLALRDIDPLGGPTYIGTPAYMSPEQARGEGHRVDGRSDIFSVGVILYELLTGQRPFRAADRESLFDEILYTDPEHPRSIRHDVPVELARVCLKSLSKSISDRYQTADQLANDLLEACSLPTESTHGGRGDASDAAAAREVETIAITPRLEVASPLPQKIVPKGLRPFDTRDSDFFLQLLPGPVDRNGVPEIVRFWLSKLAASKLDEPLTVGLIYGPSGCGKTSLVRAGIIPRLPLDVVTIYVQATAEETEKALVNQIVAHTALPFEAAVEGPLDVVDALARLRRLRQQRTIIFIDQFEQWLFAHPDCQRERLTQALRQCDGEYVQCVLLVRDDFWMGVTRLMQSLDLSIAENVNVTAVDLFDTRHARRVLAMFGAAYGRLPESSSQFTPGQNRFLDAALGYLASDGRVICVQLALLAEMLKSHDWEKTSGVFKDGGAGLGMRFFEETFEGENTPRRIRIHAEGTRRVLHALLPESGSRIKGARRTEGELLVASGYREKSSFRQLISILDHELHLITPTDRSDEESLSGDSPFSDAASSGFQLTHDFLIAPIRQWLEYHSRTTAQGKARLRLEEFAELYHLRPRPQSLPTVTEYLAIRRHVRPESCSDLHLQMLSAAQRRHLQTAASWLTGLAVVLLVVLAASTMLRQRSHLAAGQASMERLLDAQMSEAVELAGILRDHEYVRQQALVLVSDPQAPVEHRVRAALVTAGTDIRADRLVSRYVLDGNVDDVVEIARGFDLPFAEVDGELLEVWQAQSAPRTVLLRAACMLANDPLMAQHLTTPSSTQLLLKLLLSENPLRIQRWSEGFAPIGDALVDPLASWLSESPRSESSLNAANLLVAFAPTQLSLLASLLATAHPVELPVLVEAIGAAGKAGTDAVTTQWENLQRANARRVDPARPWGSPWWCVGSRTPIETNDWRPLSDELLERLDDAEAWVANHAILAHRLPHAELAMTVEELALAGYRVAQLLAFSSGEQRHWFVLWIRDGASSESVHDVTTEGLREAHARLQAAGWIADSVSAYPDEAGEIRYSGVWVHAESVDGVLASDMYIDVHQDVHAVEGWQPMVERGIGLPRSNLHVQKPDGFDYFTSVRWKLGSLVGYQDSWNQPLEEFRARQELARGVTLLTGRLSQRAATATDRGVTATWWLDLPIESIEIPYRGWRDHLRMAQQLDAEGYYPQSIDVARFGHDATPLLTSTWWRPQPTAAVEIVGANLRRNLAIALFRLGNTQPVQAAMRSDASPALRGAMIAGFTQFDLPPDWLLEQLSDPATEASVRRSCARALALYPAAAVSQPSLERAGGIARAIERENTDPGLRSAMLRLASAWQLPQEPVEEIASQELHSVAGDRLVVLRPENPVWIGSPAHEPGRDGTKEPLTPVTLQGPFAIATEEVTVRQFSEYRDDHEYARDYAVTDDCPVINVSWYDAAKYCRWLSEKEGVPESEMCYPPLEEIGPHMRLEENYIARTGYRLPTEAEWEYAARGGIDAGRWFGFDPDRLDDHAWTTNNSGYRLRPVAQLLPNDYGLFDLFGNAMEWCHAVYEPYPRLMTEPWRDPGADCLEIRDDHRMSTRGGAMLYQPLDARAAQRDYHTPSIGRVYITFRIARTVEP